jgi:hypothetical protein
MLTEKVWAGLLGAACTVLSAAVEQEGDSDGGGGGGSVSPEGNNSDRSAGDGRSGPAPSALLHHQQPSVRVTPACVDAALRLLEQMAASPGGRRALRMGDDDHRDAAGVAHAEQAADCVAHAQQNECGDARRLPHLLFRLMECTEDGQVLESLVIVLVDCAHLLLPHLAADPRPLGRLSQLVAEVTPDAQETVVQTVWFLTAAAMQRLVAAARSSSSAPQHPAGTRGAAATGAAAAPHAEPPLAAFEILHAQLALLPEFESCGAHAARCRDMLRKLGALRCDGPSE